MYHSSECLTCSYHKSITLIYDIVTGLTLQYTRREVEDRGLVCETQG